MLCTFMLRICIKKGMEDRDVEEWQGGESCGVSMFVLYISTYIYSTSIRVDLYDIAFNYTHIRIYIHTHIYI